MSAPTRNYVERCVDQNGRSEWIGLARDCDCTKYGHDKQTKDDTTGLLRVQQSS